MLGACPILPFKPGYRVTVNDRGNDVAEVVTTWDSRADTEEAARP